jgi:bifunctional ADP-heptose synthase (sugar kinase/adenylyltransferase)
MRRNSAVKSAADEWATCSPSLRSLVARFASVRVWVIGDAILDQYHFGRIERLSPEAPVPIFVEERQEGRRGGADHVAHQLEALGCDVTTVFAQRASVKHRYFVGHHPVFRIDEDFQAEPSLDVLPDDRPIADVVVLSDYAKGVLTAEVCQHVISWGIPVVVDPKGKDWFKYHGCAVLCPNARELADGPIGASLTPILEKRGADGIRVWQRGDYLDVPAQARHVYDVTGAGDVVVAVVAAALGVGSDLASAARIATYAAGYAVGEVGTAICPKQKLLELLP